jgi:hypothetical protein
VSTVHVRGWILGAALSLAPIAVSTPARAQAPVTAADRARARANFQEGVVAYQRGDFNVALAAFQTAYRIAPHPSVRINIANCYAQLHQPVEALTFFEAFLHESPTTPPEQFEAISHQIEQLRSQIAEVRVRIEPSTVHDPIVSVDGQATSIQNVVRMTPGHHVVETSAEGFPARRTEVEATAGMRSDVVVNMNPPPPVVATNVAPATTTATAAASPAPEASASPSPAPVVVATAPASPPPASSSPTSTSQRDIDIPRDENHGWPRTILLAGAGATALALIGWVTFGSLALVENGTFNDALSQFQNTSDPGTMQTQMQRGLDAASSARTFAAVSDVLLGTTIVFAGVTAFIFTRTDLHPHAAVAPVVGTNMTGLSVGGSF